jgi:hypothetical protein
MTKRRVLLHLQVLDLDRIKTMKRFNRTYTFGQMQRGLFLQYKFDRAYHIT